MKEGLETLIIELADVMDRIMRTSVDRSGLWFSEYYNERQREIENKKEKRKIYQQIYHLKRFGYIDEKGFTIKGIKKLIVVRGKKDKDKKWDGKWRVVIFDIPEKQKRLRDMLRNFLLDLGFRKLQHSVWLSPYDNFKEIQHLIKSYKIAHFVVLMVVDKISNDLLFKKTFKL